MTIRPEGVTEAEGKRGQHTPGPWEAIKWVTHEPTTVVMVDRHGTPGTRHVVAECSGHGRYTADCIADACLIAAAPALLAACRQVFERLDNLYDVDQPGGDSPRYIESPYAGAGEDMVTLRQAIYDATKEELPHV